jgi:hypothetical protein
LRLPVAPLRRDRDGLHGSWDGREPEAAGLLRRNGDISLTVTPNWMAASLYRSWRLDRRQPGIGGGFRPVRPPVIPQARQDAT